jgi:hypothetical protein
MQYHVLRRGYSKWSGYDSILTHHHSIYMQHLGGNREPNKQADTSLYALSNVLLGKDLRVCAKYYSIMDCIVVGRL